MTAWDILIANSSLPSGTAWEHLNSQVGGTKTFYEETHIVLEKDLTVTLTSDLSTVLEEDLIVTLEPDEETLLPLEVIIND